MQKKYQRQTREHWQQIVERFHASGQSGVAFCKSQAISYASFCKWRQSCSKQTQQDSTGSPPAGFLDLHSLVARDTGWKIVLRLGADIELVLSQP